MNPRRKKGLVQVIVGVVVLIVAIFLYWYGNRAPEVTNFTECAEAGFPVMESYPRQCRTPNDKTFREDIGNELEKDDLVRISEPRPNATITSPVIVKGMARGNWFFEASFPIRMIDGNGETIGQGIAEARAPWMTTEFVPFEAKLQFTAPATPVGILLLDKDNPSGLPENDDVLQIPVRFK